MRNWKLFTYQKTICLHMSPNPLKSPHRSSSFQQLLGVERTKDGLMIMYQPSMHWGTSTPKTGHSTKMTQSVVALRQHTQGGASKLCWVYKPRTLVKALVQSPPSWHTSIILFKDPFPVCKSTAFLRVNPNWDTTKRRYYKEAPKELELDASLSAISQISCVTGLWEATLLFPSGRSQRTPKIWSGFTSQYNDKTICRYVYIHTTYIYVSKINIYIYIPKYIISLS